LSAFLVQDDPSKGQTLLSDAATTRVSDIVLGNAPRSVILSRSLSSQGPWPVLFREALLEEKVPAGAAIKGLGDGTDGSRRK